MGIHLFRGDFTERFVSALCNTFLHSIWQGLLLAVLAALIVAGTKKTTSATRYNLLVSVLSLFVVGTCITFILEFKQTSGTRISQPASTLYASVESGPLKGSYPFEEIRSVGWIAFDYLNNFSNTIVLIWFLIICAKSLQLAMGLRATFRLKVKDVFPLNGEWTVKAERLAFNLGIGQAITVLESGLAKAPMVIGNFKPVVLIPIGLITALPPDAVEAILIHELAHIKRRDYLANLVQSLVEMVFFFNPAIIWVSNLIRTERENCCDDLALEQKSNPIAYVRALISCQEYRTSAPPYALSLQGSDKSIINRANRILYNTNSSLGIFQKGILAICLVCFGLFFSAFSETGRTGNASPTADRPIVPSSNAKLGRQNGLKKKTEIIAGRKQKLSRKLTHSPSVSTGKQDVLRDQDSIKGPKLALKPAVIKLKLKIMDSLRQSKSIPLVPKSTPDTTDHKKEVVRPVTKLKLQFSSNGPVPNIK